MRIGVVGAGTIGRMRIQTIKENPSTQLAVVFDISAEAAKNAASGTGAAYFTDLKSFLRAEMEAIIVSTPPHLHEEACVGAVETGFHVLCEKPLSKGYRIEVEAYGNLGMVRGSYAPMFNLLITHPRPGGPRKKTQLHYPEIVLREKLKTW